MIVRVGNFNLFQFCAPPYAWYIKKDRFDEKQWEEKKNWIKKTIEKMNCQIIGFEEIFSQNELKELLEELGFNYFATVDKPRVDEKRKIFTTTTLALASKYPIKELQKVKPHGKSIIKHKFEGHFRFSRFPIKAIITLPNNLDITVYVNHFKSNRLNEFEYIFNKTDSLKKKIDVINEALEKSYSPALRQRLCETSSLYFDFKRCKTPIICLCDLNDKEYSLCIDALTNTAYHQNLQKDFYLLFDSYYLWDKKIYNPHPDKKYKRTPTSYYQGFGNVIDYIFVSKHFNKNSKYSIGKVNSYEVFDQHLQKTPDGKLTQSDHAAIVCELKIN